MKNDRLVIAIIIVVLAAACGGVFYWLSNSNSGSSGQETEESAGDEGFVDSSDIFENGVTFDEEEEDAVIEKIDAPDEDFIGSWTATSDMAIYLYGNIDINIKPGGVWTGNITEEDIGGTWNREGPDLHIVSTDGDIDLILAFTKGGKLVMQRDLSEDGEDSDFVNTVLTRK